MHDDEYRKHATVEDDHWYFRSLHAHIARELFRAAVPGRAMRILDAGCGTGGLLKRLSAARPEWQYCGVDFSPLACQLSRERTGAEIIEASIEHLPYPDGSYDAVLSADVICQVDDPAAAVSEFFRILRPGGMAIVNLPAHPWLWSYHDVHCGNKRRYSRPQIRTLFATAGFRGIQIGTWNTFAFPAIVVRRKLLKARESTDVERPSRPTQAAMLSLSALERAWIDLGFKLPLGTSWLTVARRPLAGERM